MNTIVLQFANGNMFFIGIGMVVLASAIYLLLNNNRFLRSVLSIVIMSGMAFAIMSGTPLPDWLYGLWLVLSVIVLFINKFKISSIPPTSFRQIIFGLVAFVSLVMVLLELPYHISPVISGSSGRHVYVVGDSISSGIDANERVWPLVLGDLAHVKVTNLARPGATVESALTQAAMISESNCLIIVEIGGNDLLGGPDSRIFYNQLDNLLSKLCLARNQVVMFETPLFPFRNSLGHAQRILAKKHGVALLPKKYLTNIIGMKNATLDGLHFSQTGHDAMAKEVFDALSFQTPP
jgi:acyl-CoA thioesterase-1